MNTRKGKIRKENGSEKGKYLDRNKKGRIGRRRSMEKEKKEE